MPTPTSIPDHQRIREIQQRERAADEGPWIFNVHPECMIPEHVEQIKQHGRTYTIATPVHTNHQTAANMSFIAHARQDIPWLIGLVGVVAKWETIESVPDDERVLLYCANEGGVFVGNASKGYQDQYEGTGGTYWNGNNYRPLQWCSHWAKLPAGPSDL